MVESPDKIDRWHDLLNSRYVCELCLTRFFVNYHTCPACHQIGYVRPLIAGLSGYARSDEELRQIISHGQTLPEVWQAPLEELEEDPEFGSLS
jgi:hypothetical protein